MLVLHVVVDVVAVGKRDSYCCCLKDLHHYRPSASQALQGTEREREREQVILYVNS